MFGIGMQELLIILVVALVVLGPTKLPGVARSIGKGMRELRRASDDLRSTIMFEDDEPARGRYTQPPPAQPVASAPPAQTVAEKIAEESPAIQGSLAAGSAAATSAADEAAGTVARGSQAPAETPAEMPAETPAETPAQKHAAATQAEPAPAEEASS